jgi:hypothetical protein
MVPNDKLIAAANEIVVVMKQHFTDHPPAESTPDLDAGAAQKAFAVMTKHFQPQEVTPEAAAAPSKAHVAVDTTAPQTGKPHTPPPAEPITKAPSKSA